MNAPQGLKYASTDEWVSVEGKIATLGISDFAQDQLSDIVFFEANVEVGDTIAKDATVASVESVKAAADVKFPASGKVTAINTALPDTPEKINTDPYGEAWMIKVELSNPSELDSLMDAGAYTAFCETRGK